MKIKQLAMIMSVVMLTVSCAPLSFAEKAERTRSFAPAGGKEAAAPRRAEAAGAEIICKEDTVRLEITGAADLLIYADLNGETYIDLRAGDVVEVTGLAAGEYELEIDYMEAQKGVPAFRTTVTVAGKKNAGTQQNAQPGRDKGKQAKENQSENRGKKPPKDSEKRNPQVELITPPKGNDHVVEAITPPPKGDDHVVEAITPPPKGDNNTVEAITPPPKGDDHAAELITPPPKGDDHVVELITPAPNHGNHGNQQENKPSVRQIEARVTSGRDWIEVKVTKAEPRPVYVAVGNDFVKTANVGETVRFEQLSAGKYDIEVDYLQPIPGSSPFRSTVDIVYSYARQIAFSAVGGRSGIEVVVTDASTLPVSVRVLQGRREVKAQKIEGGVGKVSFDGLAAGTYSVSVNYDPQQWGVEARTQDNIVVTGEMKSLKILSVKPGENVIAVAGTAQPNTDIALTTAPESGTTIVRSDNKGMFSANIVLSAGAYTQVKATYVADNAVSDTAKGRYIVTTSVRKPELVVDPISNKTQRVTARTNPGVTVNLRIKAYNYGQTVTADANGLLRYSLPQTYPRGTTVTFTVFYGEHNALSYVKTVAVGEEATYPLLKYGDTGSAVKALTKRLEELGYLEDDTSRYSSAVREAVRRFQEINGLDADGIAGYQTQSVLFSSSAIPYGAAGRYPTLSRGDKGIAAVYRLQERLKDLGYYTIAVDGIYGSGTERAVRHFQRINGLEKTGVADSTTQRLLYSSSAKAANSSSAAAYKTLSRSSTYHPAVVPLQRRLKALGYAVGSADGYFGSRTYRAVRDFQKRNGLSVTGVADETTQRVLFSASAVPAAGASAPSVSVSYRLLGWGSTGDDVLKLQRTLLAKGYTQVRVADGVYGEWTCDAVRAFQRDHGLSVDGIAGRDTLNALYGTNY